MSDIPVHLRYTATHEWVHMEEDGSFTIGVTDHAQTMLGDIVFIELPEAGEVAADQECGLIESAQAAMDIYCPFAGDITEINENLSDSPDLLNSDPYGDGWLYRLNPIDEEDYDELMDADEYEEYLIKGQH